MVLFAGSERPTPKHIQDFQKKVEAPSRPNDFVIPFVPLQEKYQQLSSRKAKACLEVFLTYDEVTDETQELLALQATASQEFFDTGIHLLLHSTNSALQELGYVLAMAKETGILDIKFVANLESELNNLGIGYGDPNLVEDLLEETDENSFFFERLDRSQFQPNKKGPNFSEWRFRLMIRPQFNEKMLEDPILAMQELVSVAAQLKMELARFLSITKKSAFKEELRSMMDLAMQAELLKLAQEANCGLTDEQRKILQEFPEGLNTKSLNEVLWITYAQTVPRVGDLHFPEEFPNDYGSTYTDPNWDKPWENNKN